MKDLQKEKIERIERKLLKAHRISTDELREIVSDPQFFDKINARIKAEQTARNLKNGTRHWTIFPALSWQKTGAAFGALAIIFAIGSGLIFFTRQELSTARLIESVASPEIQKPIAALDEPPPEFSKNQEAENEFQNKRERIAFKNKNPKLKAQVSGKNLLRNHSRAVRNETEDVFYPLAFAENLEEAKKDGRVIRVELSRSSLLALGLNPPMDDEVLKIKTDLLVGSDGVALGIRFVK